MRHRLFYFISLLGILLNYKIGYAQQIFRLSESIKTPQNISYTDYSSIIIKTSGIISQFEQIISEKQPSNNISVLLGLNTNINILHFDFLSLYPYKYAKRRGLFLLQFEKAPYDSMHKILNIIKQSEFISEASFSQLYKLSANDPKTTYSLSRTEADPKAWNKISCTERRAVTQIIAIVDGGFNVNHEDLTNVLWSNPNEIPGNGIDDDGNTLIDDIHGYDFANDRGNIADDSYCSINGIKYDHGTHVAGIAGAQTNNNIGIASNNYANVDFPIRLMLLRAQPDYVCDIVDFYGIYKSWEYAIENGVKIINNSFGGSPQIGATPTPSDRYLLDIMQDNPDVAFIFSAGNESKNLDIFSAYPQNFDESIVVVNTDALDIINSQSNYGSRADISAPGTDINSCSINQSNLFDNTAYRVVSGTSMAAPFVSGCVGYLKAYFPEATVQEIVTVILQSTDNIYPANLGKTGLMGSGRINLSNAVDKLITRYPKKLLKKNTFNIDCDNEGVALLELLKPTNKNIEWLDADRQSLNNNIFSITINQEGIFYVKLTSDNCPPQEDTAQVICDDCIEDLKDQNYLKRVLETQYDNNLVYHIASMAMISDLTDGECIYLGGSVTQVSESYSLAIPFVAKFNKRGKLKWFRQIIPSLSYPNFDSNKSLMWRYNSCKHIAKNSSANTLDIFLDVAFDDPSGAKNYPLMCISQLNSTTGVPNSTLIFSNNRLSTRNSTFTNEIIRIEEDNDAYYFLVNKMNTGLDSFNTLTNPLSQNYLMTYESSLLGKIDKSTMTIVWTSQVLPLNSSNYIGQGFLPSNLKCFNNKLYIICSNDKGSESDKIITYSLNGNLQQVKSLPYSEKRLKIKDIVFDNISSRIYGVGYKDAAGVIFYWDTSTDIFNYKEAFSRTTKIINNEPVDGQVIFSDLIAQTKNNNTIFQYRGQLYFRNMENSLIMGEFDKNLDVPVDNIGLLDINSIGYLKTLCATNIQDPIINTTHFKYISNQA